VLISLSLSLSLSDQRQRAAGQSVYVKQSQSYPRAVAYAEKAGCVSLSFLCASFGCWSKAYTRRSSYVYILYLCYISIVSIYLSLWYIYLSIYLFICVCESLFPRSKIQLLEQGVDQTIELWIYLYLYLYLCYVSISILYLYISIIVYLSILMG